MLVVHSDNLASAPGSRFWEGLVRNITFTWAVEKDRHHIDAT
jgi:hypothetical protein